MSRICLTARAVIIHDGHILLCKYTDETYFLPGGHIEPGETAREALARELQEELGFICVIGEFVASFEELRPYPYLAKRCHSHANHFFFYASHQDLVPSHTPEHRDHGLETFIWVRFDALEELDLWPKGVLACLPVFGNVYMQAPLVTDVQGRQGEAYTFSITARAIVEAGSKVLVCQNLRKDVPTYVLPGGHIEPGERAVAALKRELQEELGIGIGEPEFLGVHEQFFCSPTLGNLQAYAHLFRITYPEPISIVAREEHLVPLWIERVKLGKIAFYPKNMPWTSAL